MDTGPDQGFALRAVVGLWLVGVLSAWVLAECLQMGLAVEEKDMKDLSTRITSRKFWMMMLYLGCMTFLGYQLIVSTQADQLMSLGAFAGAVAGGLYGYFRENVKAKEVEK
jgi:hypothetical protein